MGRRFSLEFRFGAVKLVRERGVSVAQAGGDLDVAESVLRGWMRELAEAPASAPGQGQMCSELAEVAALTKEVARLRAERETPRKAAAVFSKEST